MKTKANRKAKRAASRKQRPIDPQMGEVLRYIDGMKNSEVAQRSGGLVGSSTIANWRAGKVRCPLNYTIDAALKAAGYERTIRKIGKGRVLVRGAEDGAPLVH